METAAKLVVFANLRGLERLVRPLEIRARVGHRGIEPELEELVAQIVVLADVFAAHLATVRAAKVEQPVGEIQEVERSGATPVSSLHRLGFVGVQDKPGDDFHQVGGRPLARHVALSETNRTVEHAALEEVFVQNLDPGMNPCA